MSKANESSGSKEEDHAERLSKLYLCRDTGKPRTLIIPLNQVLRKEGFRCLSYGNQSKAYQHHKVIMLVGATGAGKSTLINAMINYIIGTKWNDDYRFKIVDEVQSYSQAHSQTQITTLYTIHRNKHHTIPYTLTIIDTPGFGDTRGIERDKAIVHQIREFFSHPEDHHVDHLDAVGFVAKSTDARLTPTHKYIFDSMLALYGKDIEPNIMLLATFSDKARPKVISALREAEIRCEDNLFKFNNSALFATNVETTESDTDQDDLAIHHAYWKMGMKNMKSFFESLERLEPVSIFLTKEVLLERLRLENISEHLYQQIQAINTKVGQMKRDKKMLESQQGKTAQNAPFPIPCYAKTFEWVETEKKAMNCTTCEYTCHFPCSRMKISNYQCRVFDIKGKCTVCPRKCKTRDHSMQSVRKKPQLVKKMMTYKDIKGRYEKAAGRELSVQEVIQDLKTDIQDHFQCLQGLNFEAASCMRRLQEIALKPQISVKDHLDMFIEREKKDQELGWEDRVAELEIVKSRHEALECGGGVKYKARVLETIMN
ncbi:uncharacterized protein LOC110981949 [Acanthaster planci]|uniref:Uncharacterized protein LOC110981949 n=1 Tax=Acanthaster planci TaxID=133434 RepID=A0A8B7YWN4_ACAPL|nr:uncharacterized protein LOC110981949 [Acanthaster planci]